MHSGELLVEQSRAANANGMGQLASLDSSAGAAAAPPPSIVLQQAVPQQNVPQQNVAQQNPPLSTALDTSRPIDGMELDNDDRVTYPDEERQL